MIKLKEKITGIIKYLKFLFGRKKLDFNKFEIAFHPSIEGGLIILNYKVDNAYKIILNDSISVPLESKSCSLKAELGINRIRITAFGIGEQITHSHDVEILPFKRKGVKLKGSQLNQYTLEVTSNSLKNVILPKVQNTNYSECMLDSKNTISVKEIPIKILVEVNKIENVFFVKTFHKTPNLNDELELQRQTLRVKKINPSSEELMKVMKTNSITELEKQLHNYKTKLL